MSGGVEVNLIIISLILEAKIGGNYYFIEIRYTVWKNSIMFEKTVQRTSIITSALSIPFP